MDSRLHPPLKERDTDIAEQVAEVINRDHHAGNAIETHLGLSYWSLAHPRSQPEFHDRAGFVGGISVPEDLF